MALSVRNIKQSRFNSLAAYARDPRIKSHSVELEWYESSDGKILGTLINDKIDDDYVGLILARDLNRKYRFILHVAFESSIGSVRKKLINKMIESHPNADELGIQLDETAETMDFFMEIEKNSNKKDPDYSLVETNEYYSGAKGIIEPLMRWYEDIDGNFVEQFQTNGFKQRLWEIYLFSIFTENDCVFDTSHNAPDFLLKHIKKYSNLEFCVEATTVNPPQNNIPQPDVDDEKNNIDLLRNYFPTRYSGPLTAKLKKKYWEKEHVAGKPLVLAICDCQFKNASNITCDSLPIYLYGFEQISNEDGSATRLEIKNHVWGTKVVPSGFFNLPDAENISAVIAPTCFDIDKFNRLGLINEFNTSKYKLKRIYEIGNVNTLKIDKITKILPSKKYTERWDEGMRVYHNPNALFPFPQEVLPEASHFSIMDGMLIIEYFTPPVFSDTTEIIVSK